MTREELAKKIKSANNGHLGKKLEDLVYCNLIRKNIVREKEIKKKDAIYQVCDFFCLFYLTFIDRAEVEQQYWSHHINTPEINTSYSWRSKTSSPAAQIDIIIERADNIVHICEVKYCHDEYELSKEEYEKINNRKSTFIKETCLRHTPWLTLITTEGLAPGKYTDMIQSVVTQDALFT